MCDDYLLSGSLYASGHSQGMTRIQLFLYSIFGVLPNVENYGLLLSLLSSMLSVLSSPSKLRTISVMHANLSIFDDVIIGIQWGGYQLPSYSCI